MYIVMLRKIRFDFILFSFFFFFFAAQPKRLIEKQLLGRKLAYNPLKMHLRKATFILCDAFSRPVSKPSMFFNSQVERILENRFCFNDMKILEVSGKKCFALLGSHVTGLQSS